MTGSKLFLRERSDYVWDVCINKSDHTRVERQNKSGSFAESEAL
jgi:hypothetical protein